MTPEELRAAIGCSATAAERWARHLTDTCNCYGIDTPIRRACWLGQIGTESGLLAILEENLNYSAARLIEVFPHRFKPEEASVFERKPEQIAERVYGGRMGNGPEGSGDGWKFRGRGLIQITGRWNYRACGQGLGIELELQPDLLATDRLAAMSAGWFWESKGLNSLADARRVEDITRKVNGGLNGLQERQRLTLRAANALGAA